MTKPFIWITNGKESMQLKLEECIPDGWQRGRVFRHCFDTLRRTHGLSSTKLYNVWLEMVRRCTKPTSHAWKYYGGRGIQVCDEWKNNFQAFYDWAIANGYEEGLWIERKDNDSNYEPDNCCWTTRSAQMKNRRSFDVGGRKKAAQERKEKTSGRKDKTK